MTTIVPIGQDQKFQMINIAEWKLPGAIRELQEELHPHQIDNHLGLGQISRTTIGEVSEDAGKAAEKADVNVENRKKDRIMTTGHHLLLRSIGIDGHHKTRL